MIQKFLLGLSMMFFLSAPSQAFDAGSQPIKVVMPFAPGGGVDQTFRHFENWAAKKNIKFVAVYRPGAEGLIGMNEIAAMPKDGYHISFATAGTIAVQRLKNPQAELETVTLIKNSIMAFVTHKDSGIRSLTDLYQGNPKTLAYGAPGQLMTIQQLIELSDGKMKGSTLVPYKGGAPVVQDIAGNHVQFAAVPLLITKSFVDSGTIRLLAVDSTTRLAEYPNIPTFKEIFPKWKSNDGFAVVLPKGTDTKAVEFWNSILKEYVTDQKVQADFLKDYNMSQKFGKEELEKTVSNAVDALEKK